MVLYYDAGNRTELYGEAFARHKCISANNFLQINLVVASLNHATESNQAAKHKGSEIIIVPFRVQWLIWVLADASECIISPKARLVIKWVLHKGFRTRFNCLACHIEEI